MRSTIHEIKDVRKAVSNAPTNAEFIAAVAAKTIVLDEIHVSADAACYIEFDQATTAIGPAFHLGANEYKNGKNLNLRVPLGVELSYSCDTTASIVVYGQYHLESGKMSHLASDS
jgi:hypothetical protein